MASILATIVTTADGLTWLATCAAQGAVLLGASWLGATLLRRGAAAARHQLWALGVVGALLLPLVGWALAALSLPSPLPVLSISSVTAPTVASTIEAAPQWITAGDAAGAAPSWPAWLALAWGAGALVLLARVVRGHLAARRLARAASPSIAPAWSLALREAAGSLGVTRAVTVLRSEAIGSPMTVGVVRPRVLLPADADAWSPARLRAVLVHELGHVRRHDTAIQLAAQLACALYWWNPLTWLAAARLRIEREHACDDLVLAAGVLPSDYASDLLDVARTMARDAHARAGAVCIVDASWTEARLRRILDASAPRRPPRARFRVAVRAVALAATVTLACTSSPPAPASSDATPRTALAPARATLVSVGPFSGPPSTRPRSSFEGGVDLPQVTATLEGRLGELEQCYRRRLAVKLGLAGTVLAHWTIAERGEVPDVCITSSTVDDQELSDCVNALVVAGGFPAPRAGSVAVTYPFVFAPPAR